MNKLVLVVLSAFTALVFLNVLFIIPAVVMSFLFAFTVIQPTLRGKDDVQKQINDLNDKVSKLTFKINK
jgi:hypothetical protein